ncbi:hypothetical protein [Arcticibacter eurypsychrophilus]|uniref:hypothetical protein n=1 Tax=Arcticibacter eurypsychrophilus TaxID=1434752 RepID=UPI00084D4291|nr:hypothetical protein [Arcticibacter eurypsychrophilus]
MIINSIETLSVIVFSKDRPLQLQAYLKSLIYFSKIEQSSISVLYKYNLRISYQKLLEEFPEIHWVKENVFFNDLTYLINRSTNYIMFGCDDVIFNGWIDIPVALNILSKNPNVFGFSLRLGENIKPVLPKIHKFENHLEWNWKTANVINWSYPWELDSTIYRKINVIEILAQLNPERIKNPNFLESDVAEHPNLFIKKEGLASFKNGKCIVLTINRVQDDFQNSFDNSFNTDIKSLYELHLNDNYIDFQAISKIPTSKIHVGVKYFVLAGNSIPHNGRLKILVYYAKNIYLSFKRRCFHN